MAPRPPETAVQLARLERVPIDPTVAGSPAPSFIWTPNSGAVFGRTLSVRENEICSAAVGNVIPRSTSSIRQGRADRNFILVSANPKRQVRRVRPRPSIAPTHPRHGIPGYRAFGRDAVEPLFPEHIEQGAGKSRGAALSGRFTDYRRKIGVYQEKVDFHSLKATFATDVANLPGLNAGWGDEVTGNTSRISGIRAHPVYQGGVLKKPKGTPSTTSGFRVTTDAPLPWADRRPGTRFRSGDRPFSRPGGARNAGRSKAAVNLKKRKETSHEDRRDSTSSRRRPLCRRTSRRRRPRASARGRRSACG